MSLELNWKNELEKSNEIIEKLKSTHQNELATLEASNKDLQDKYTSLEQKSRAESVILKKKAEDRFKAQIQELKDALLSTTQANTESTNSYKQTISDRDLKIENLSKELENKQNDLERIQAQYNNLSNDLREKQGEIEELNREKEGLQATLRHTEKGTFGPYFLECREKKKREFEEMMEGVKEQFGRRGKGKGLFFREGVIGGNKGFEAGGTGVGI